MHRGAEIWRGVSGATFGEDPPEALSGTTQVEQSDEHLVLLRRRKENKGGGAVPARQQRVLLRSRFSRFRVCVTPWTAANQAPQSLGFSRQEHWII